MVLLEEGVPKSALLAYVSRSSARRAWCHAEHDSKHHLMAS